uniref:Uncharacterized protein MANES_08G051700 n=1 Tax=Rhizophora mucronata TaxID=61149 RepID=A0A2P2KZB8_RHIMU
MAASAKITTGTNWSAMTAGTAAAAPTATTLFLPPKSLLFLRNCTLPAFRRSLCFSPPSQSLSRASQVKASSTAADSPAPQGISRLSGLIICIRIFACMCVNWL